MHIKETFPELYQIRRPRRPEELRAELAGKQGREYWRSLEELAGRPEFEELLHSEFPRHAAGWDEAVNRRTFMKLMGASLALAGLSACSYQPPETIVPYVRQPEELVPGKPLFFATAMPWAGGALGLLVRSNEGRPTHVEGNPDHPTTGTPERPAEHRLASTNVYAQASILSLYDPDRSDAVRDRGEIRAYTTFLAEVRSALGGLRARGGAGLRFLTETITSPTAAAQMRDILRTFPGARWHVWEPAGGNNALLGAQLAFGEPVQTLYNFAAADRVVSLDSDFLACQHGADLRHSRDFIARRRVLEHEGRRAMNRLYAFETTPTNTGAKADHRWPVKPSELTAVAAALAAGVGAAGVSAPASGVPHADKLGAVVRDLQEHRGKSVVVAGEYAPPAVHALAHAMNAALGNVGQTVFYTEPVDLNPVDQAQSLRELVADIDSGQVEMLVFVGGNPVYNAPADLALTKERLDRVRLRVHLGLYEDETSEMCHWHVPETHYLEAWSDARAHDGTVSIVQPLIQPLYKGRSIHEFLAAFSDQPERSGYDIVRAYWQTQAGGGDFEQFWRRAVHDGVIPNTQARPKSVSVRGDALLFTGAYANFESRPSGLEIVFRPDPSIYDGRFANNGWLQELPKPLTKLTWDNAAFVSPATARRLLGLGENDYTFKGIEYEAPVVTLSLGGRSVEAPVFLLPGQPDDVVTVHLGYGRTLAGSVGGTKTQNLRVGFDAYKLRPSDALWSAAGLQVTPTGETYQLAGTQLHFNMEGRDIVRTDTLDEYVRQHGDTHAERESERHGGAPVESGQGAREVVGRETHKEPGHHESLYYEYENHDNYKWGMAIDVTACVGCNACVVACQSENNIPIVGKEEVARRREMHWLRIDAYFRGLAENPDGVYFMPIPCMHCEQAPCEPVCPVNATVHDADGTNNMVYNRCIGTRYCSNNCPYKVRRFNFLLYQDFDTPSLKLMRNPDVTVRSRGVMEKCTYCIQRIQWAKIESEKEGRRVRDGEVQTACQSACPVEAIIFGDLNDRGSRVAKLQAEPRNYSLLAELNTRPRTTYLAAMRNPNPALPHSTHAESHGGGH